MHARAAPEVRGHRLSALQARALLLSAAGRDDTTYDLSYADCALRPFDKYKSRTIIFEGFGYGMGQGGAMGEIYVPMHGAMAMFLTGSAARAQDWYANVAMQNASLDHYLAQKYGGTLRSARSSSPPSRTLDRSPRSARSRPTTAAY